ncbi:glycine-rich cell wall structural protein-like [Rhodamnia argentea]|uniref:Glycine-rich cell wall structural protein-like n=1 Tax=Rhodamnia argentea TaxID=178133 RepID=A0ABM3HJ60_9MYRT|nr:glycine-rich cell wall structural protein-like [Rhodamnia argentea]
MYPVQRHGIADMCIPKGASAGQRLGDTSGQRHGARGWRPVPELAGTVTGRRECSTSAEKGQQVTTGKRAVPRGSGRPKLGKSLANVGGLRGAVGGAGGGDRWPEAAVPSCTKPVQEKRGGFKNRGGDLSGCSELYGLRPTSGGLGGRCVVEGGRSGWFGVAGIGGGRRNRGGGWATQKQGGWVAGAVLGLNRGSAAAHGGGVAFGGREGDGMVVGGGRKRLGAAGAALGSPNPKQSGDAGASGGCSRRRTAAGEAEAERRAEVAGGLVVVVGVLVAQK